MTRIGLATITAALLFLGTAPAEAQGRREKLRERWKKAREDRQKDKASDKASDKKGKDSKKAKAVHGGKLVSSAGHQFEVVLLEKEIRIYATREGKPVELKGATAKINIAIVRRDVGKRRNRQGSTAKLGYVGKSSKRGRLRGYLSGSHNLGKSDRQALKMEITISRVPKVKGAVSFEVSGVGASTQVTYRCDTCSTEKKKRLFLDPGTCPTCKNELEREALPEGERKGAFRGKRR
jgi:hypothetical protein